ncbi:uncharacterized protein HKW66_Vig0146750 [Vigna angularis]|uniref:Uncharacterized protein n=1 Tax=Phaseolus angularis TaxID=3914 RepID=A0A8T0KCS7_PHAAN|nr:uncharacterized protein HKW66_Vig0146750 [Vigna angularis]
MNNKRHSEHVPFSYRLKFEHRTRYLSTIDWLYANPVAVEPLLMNPNCGGRVHDLLASGGEINIVVVIVDLAGDLAHPPAVVVKGVDALAERKGGGGDEARRLGAKLFGEESLGEGLGPVVLQQRVVAYDVEAVVEARHDGGEVVGAEEALLVAAHLYLVAVAEIHLLLRWSHRRRKGFLNTVVRVQRK